MSDPCINGKLGAAQQEICAEYYYTSSATGRR
jgi:hypothetical protein